MKDFSEFAVMAIPGRERESLRLGQIEFRYTYQGHWRIVSLEEILSFAEDVASHGLRIDMSPTVYAGGGEIDANTTMDMYLQMCNYMKRGENSLKERAKRALGLLKPKAEEYGEDEEA